MKILTKIVPPLDVNCYTIIDETTDNRLIIDVGAGFDEIIKDNPQKEKIVGALFTHGHFDHAVDGYKFQNIGVKTYITETDNEILSNSKNLGQYCG